MPAITVRPLRESDLPVVGRIIPLAFGTFLGRPPDAAQLDADDESNTAAVRARWLSGPDAAFVAELDGQVAGSVFATHWGSVGFFGPLTVHPDHWEQGIGKHLLEPVMQTFKRWDVTHAGLFTFAQSPKHLHLYQRFDFWPRFLTAIMRKPVATSAAESQGWSRFSALSDGERAACVAACHALTSTLYPGLDVARDIQAVQTLHLGDTILLWDGDQLVGVAVCHWGPSSEADAGACYVKFGAVPPGPDAEQRFTRLLRACEALAASAGSASLEVGVNMGRHQAYRALLARGWHTAFQGVAMHRPNTPGYSHTGIYAIDDWR